MIALHLKLRYIVGSKMYLPDEATLISLTFVLSHSTNVKRKRNILKMTLPVAGGMAPPTMKIAAIQNFEKQPGVIRHDFS